MTISSGIFMRSLMVGASTMALASFPGAALAEDVGGLADIVVTAQKKAENLQKVPLAVTAVTMEQLENRQVQNLNSLSGIAPNVTQVTSVSGSDPIITMRGIVGGNATNGTDSAIAMYIDGVYLARTTGASFDVADLERVEVLRGPQGTLYGRSSTGGAVNFITAGPKGEFGARLDATIGNQDRRRFKLRADTPTFNGFSFTGSYLHDEAKGWIRNQDGGLTWNFEAANPNIKGDRKSAKRLGSFDTDAGFFAARYEAPSGKLQADYKFDISSSTRTNQAQQILVDYTTLVPSALVSLDRLKTLSMPMTTPEKLKAFGHNLTITADLADGLTFKSITGYRASKDTYTNDVAGSGGVIPTVGVLGFTNILAFEKTRNFQQEFQLNYESNLFDVVGGVNYYKERTTSTAPVYIFQVVPFTLPDRATLVPTVDGDVTSDNESMAAFAQATWHVTDKVDLTGGVRQTKDLRAADERGAFLGVPRTDFSSEFSNTDWTANVTYRPTDAFTAYAKASTGYLSGGVFAGFAFEPEKVDQYEVGLKADWLDRRLRTNLAVFHTDYSDLQVAAFYPVPGTSSFAYYIQNVADAEIDGFELEASVVPLPGLTVSAFYGYNDFKYKTAPAGVDNPAYRPKHNGGVDLNYELPPVAGEIKPVIDVNARYTGNQYFLTGSGSVVPYALNPDLADAIENNSAWVVDARFSLNDVPLGGNKAKVSLWTKNLFNDRDLVNATDATGGTIVNGQFRQPRTFGVDLGFEF